MDPYKALRADLISLTGPSVVENAGLISSYRSSAISFEILRSSDKLVLNPANHAPSRLSLTGAKAAAEYAAAGAEIGTLAASDADNDALAYTLLDSAGGRFMLSGNRILVADGFRLNFEQATAHTVTVQVSDGKGGVANQSFVIGVIAQAAAREVKGGSLGDDVFKAGKFNDKLSGNAGDDKLYGLAGKDVLTGGAGQDIFVFDAKFNKTTNLDKITDFNVKDDTIWLEKGLFKANKSLYSARDWIQLSAHTPGPSL